MPGVTYKPMPILLHQHSANGYRPVVDWDELNNFMPIGDDCPSRGQRIELFREFDNDDNGLLHIWEAVRAFFRCIPRVRGIIDMREVWTHCFRLARANCEPVANIGADFMEQNQFRVYIITLWYYLKIWEAVLGLANGNGSVFVRPEDVHKIPPIFKGKIQDLQLFEMNLHTIFQKLGKKVLSFNDFVDHALTEALPQVADAGNDVERRNAKYQLEKVQPFLLCKEYPAATPVKQSLETLMPLRSGMTGYGALVMKKSPASLSPIKEKNIVLQNQSASKWASNYMMNHTCNKFEPTSGKYKAVYQLPPAGKTPIRFDQAEEQRNDRIQRGARLSLNASYSAPSLGGSTSTYQQPVLGLDRNLQKSERNDLKSKFDEKLAMYNTNELRSIVKSASTAVNNSG